MSRGDGKILARAIAKKRAEVQAGFLASQEAAARAVRGINEGGKVLRLNGLMSCILHGILTDRSDDDQQPFVPEESRRRPVHAGYRAVIARANEAVECSMAWGMHCARKAHGLEWKGSPLNLSADIEHVAPLPGIDPANVQPVFPAGWNAKIYGEAG